MSSSEKTTNTIPSPLQWTPGSPVEHIFISRARSTLAGVSLAKGPLSTLTSEVSDEYIESVLTGIASAGNSDRPVAARLQSFPENVRKLIQDDGSLLVQSALRGVAYSFSERPKQFRRPVPLRLQRDQELAASAEIARLFHQCKAVEKVPDHDGDKPLRQWASAYERMRLPRGNWPREPPIPILHSESAVEAYNRKQMLLFRDRRARGIPLRDFESGVFCVAKSDGGYRLCTDYRRLNKFSDRSTFQMEGVQQVAEMLQKGDYGMLVDLKDCYLTLGLHPSHRKYCRFRSPDGTRYQWTTVSFGTAEAPQICTKILRPLIRILKSLGVRCLIYIDDLLLVDQDRLRLARAMAVAMNLLQQEVGLQLKLSKGQLLPSQHFTCLGLQWNTTAMKCFIPPKRIKALQHTAGRLLKMSAASAYVPTRDLARFHGQATSTARAIRPAKRRLLYIQHALSKAVSRGGWQGKALLSENTRTALRWWTTDAVWSANGHDIVPPPRPIQLTLRTDAATHNAGYGGVLLHGKKSFRTRGFLTAEEQAETFINQYEFSGFENSLWALVPQAIPDRRLWKNVHVSVELDNQTSIKYGRVAVSRSIKMSLKGALFFDKVEQPQLSISFRHLAGVLNVDADELSRRASTHADWKLDPTLFRAVLRAFNVRPNVDLFASAQNTQLAQFFSYQHDHRARGADAFQHSWTSLGVLYAYPPPILLGRVLQRLHVNSCQRLICIMPLWMAQVWFPTMLQMLRQPPLLLPNEAWIVSDPLGNYAWPQKWPLFAADLSGNLQLARASRKQFLRNAGRDPRTAIRRAMTSRSKLSRLGGTLPTPFYHSVLQTFGVV
jgi:hypothetical protein